MQCPIGLLLIASLGSMARGEEAPPAPGASSTAAPSTPAPSSPAPIAPQPDPREAFEQRFIGFDYFSGSAPYIGKYRRPLGPDSFYELVGRPDFAATYRQRSAERNALGVVGLLGIAAGVVYVVAVPKGPEPDINVDHEVFARQMDERSRATDAAIRTGSIISLTGMALGIVSLAINPHPIDEPEARRLADEYNQRLARSLGLTPPDAAPSLPPPPAPPPSPSGLGAQLSFGWAPARGGGVAALAVSF